MSDYQGNIIIKNPATPTGPAENGAAPGVWKLSDALGFIRQGIWPTQGVPAADPNFKYVSLLLSTTSLSNANNNLFVDSSGAFNPISRNGNTTQGSATPYSANWSNYFDGSGDYLTVPSNAAFDFGTGDFTIEGWISLNSTSSVVTIVTNYVSGGSAGWSLQYRSDIGGFRFGWGDTALLDYVTSVSRNTWYHLAVTRSGTSLRMFLNGVQVASATNSTSLTGGTTLSVGAINSGGYIQNYNGYISNLRIVKGTAVYTSAFTPPTSALTAISGTSLLTCQSNRFRDASSNNFTITRNGDTRVTDFAPFSPGSPGITYNQSDITNWSGYFDGSGDYLDIAANSAFDLSGDFTIEFWVNTTRTADSWITGYYVGNPGLVTQLAFIVIIFGGTYSISLNSGSTETVINIGAASAISNGAWNHIACTRSGNTVRTFVNGVLSTTATYSSTLNNPAGAVYRIGGLSGTFEDPFAGYISNLRVVKGTAVYTGNFTPPTTNLTAISGTSLLTLQNAAFTDNSTNNFVITPNGNVTVTGNSPFNTVGYWSNYFDGSSTLTFSQINMAGDFTIEGWIYFIGTNDPTVLGANPPNHQSLRRLATGKHYFYREGVDITGTIDVPRNQWVHLAATRSSGTVRIFTNGVLDGSRTITGTFSLFCLGGVDTGTDRLTGYTSNMRVVDGTALYTATFTPPTAPLTAVSGTALLTSQNGTFKDNSTSNLTLTRNGSPTIQSFDPFYTSTIASNGGSMYFDGSGDELGFPISPAFTLGSSNFTIEGWLYPTSLPENSTAFVLDSSTYPRVMWIYTSGAFHVYASASGSAWQIDQTPAVVVGQWNHLVFQRNGNDFRTFLNGVLVATTTSALTFPAQRSVGYIGRGDNTVQRWNGYISNFRITTGSAIYSTGGFTPPTAPVTATPATTLLVNGMNAGIYDATAINDMETVGNAQVSTAVSKFGGSSVYFDGTGDYLQLPQSPQTQFGSGDFTLEFWMYRNSSGDCALYSDRNATDYNGIMLGVRNNYIFLLASNNGSSWGIDTYASTAGSTTSTATWTHIALVRSGTTWAVYINGTQSYTRTLSGDVRQTAPNVLVGADAAGFTAFNGYIDDLRVTKGVARYTSSFTPPTQAFPTY